MVEPTEAIVLRRAIPATPERVFHALTSEAELGRWMSPVGHAEVDVDPRVGGALRVTMIGDGRRIEHTGQFVELEPPHRLVFTWTSSYTGGLLTRVTIELANAAGGTDLTLRHELLPEAARPSHAGGWTGMLDRLSALLAETGTEVAHGA